MTTTGANLLTGFSEFISDEFSSTTTSAGNAGGTTMVDTLLSRYGDGRLSGYFVRPTSGTDSLAIRKVEDNVQSTGVVEVTPAFSAQLATSVTYGLHRYDPALKFRALDKARLDILDQVFQLIYNDTITSDGRTTVYDIPSAIEVGPISAIVEKPEAAAVDWNFLSNPQGNSTDNWTATSTTASTYTRTTNDLLVPKYTDTCTSLVTAASTAATYAQTVDNMTNSITAALAADRTMTFAAWVYCTEASKIALRITDDGGAVATGSNHGGGGWELLTVEGTIAGDNATTLTATFVISSTANASTIYWENAWFYFGAVERVKDSIYRPEYALDVRRDNTTQHLILNSPPPRGYQIRLIGKAPLSALGSVAASQVTNTMEVDGNTAEILYARAAEILFQWERVATDNYPEVAQRIAMVREREPKLVRNYGQETPRIRIKNAFSR